MKPSVTIITPTTGSAQLYDAILSVENQTYDNIEHLIVVDGPEYTDKANNIIEGSKAKVIYLPHNTGANNYNGHRIYGAVSFLMNGDYVCFLDQDNWFEPNHVQSLVDVVGQPGKQWAYSLRKIVDQNGQYICNDDCESLGEYTSILNDRFVDVNCYMIPKHAAIGFTPYWYRRARHPHEQPEVDRLLSRYMMDNFQGGSNGDYTVNYRVASRPDSVQDFFFVKGNEAMKQKMNGEYPWRKKT
jgi:glycosyltransferase involved in cell wall biosynthesis